MHDRRPLFAQDAQKARDGRERLAELAPPAIGLESDDARTFGFDGGAMRAHATDHGWLIACLVRRPQHRQEMRGEEPILGDDEDKRLHRERANGNVPAALLAEAGAVLAIRLIAVKGAAAKDGPAGREKGLWAGRSSRIVIRLCLPFPSCAMASCRSDQVSVH